jgi:alpha-tubulin suppressor-like RCC1 family protein
MDDDGGGGDPCTLTNLLQPFSVTKITQTASGTSIAFPSFQFFRYLIWEANVLSTNTQWLPAAYVWGQPNQCSTTWTDMSTTNKDGSAVLQRFYRVQRLLGSPIAAGGESSVAITPDGRVWAWGGNDGELGDSLDVATTPYVEPYLPYPSDVANAASCGIQTITNAVAVAAGGDDFTVVVDSTGTVWTFGENDAGQLGNSSFNSSGLPSPEDTPTPIGGVPGFTNLVSVAAGYQHTLALRADGAVFAWGRDDFVSGSGVLGASNLNWVITSCPCFTNSPIQSLIPAGTNIVAIAAGNGFSLALDSTGQVWGWGDNTDGETGASAGGGTNVPVLVPGISNVIAIAAGDNPLTGYYNGSGGHSVALTADGRVYTWGNNYYGALGYSSTNTSSPGLVMEALTNQYIVSIAAGNGFTLAVASNGQVYAWGDNSYGELATDPSTLPWSVAPVLVNGISNAVQVSAPRSDDGICNQNPPPPGLCNYFYPNSQLPYAGGVHAMAMTLDPVDGTGQKTNHYWGWGDNSYGQIGTGTNGGGTYQVSQYTPSGPLQFCTRCQREVQLGTGGTFTAQCNGMLYLYFNTDNFGACTGQYNVTFGSLATNVPANASTGVAVGSVTNGGTYSFSANGYCTWSHLGFNTDPDGRDQSNHFVDCSDFNNINITNAVCPAWRCFSLVGKIQ